MRRNKKRRIIVLLGIIILCLFMMIAGFLVLRFRGSRSVYAREDVALAAEIIMYRQDDERWAEDALGDSSYTMKKSGCLVTCIASAISMGKEEKTPGTLNAEFSLYHVFDMEGNIIWENLRNMGEYEVDVFQAADEEILTECLKAGRYPIVRVRMHGIGAFHYVLIVKAENGEFYCMDPLEDNLTTLSAYANRIYAVRCVSLISL